MQIISLLTLLTASPALADANTDLDTDTDSDPTGETSADTGQADPADGGCRCSTGQVTSAASFGLGLLLLGAARRRRGTLG